MNKVLRVGLIGIGFMGRGHLDNYIRLEEEGFPIKLVAICDIDSDKFEGKFIKGNIAVGESKYDFSKYNLYTDMDEMLSKEELDYIDTPLPTYMHSEVAIKAMNMGLHVLCEKPMALTSIDCQKMIDAAKANDKTLMMGHCLRFWPAYEYLKETVDSKRYGEVVSGYFFRGGSTPAWSYENWLIKAEKAGGALFDQHIHDVDTINWLFGKPEAVSTIARNVVPGSGYDAVSTNYIYPDNKVINSQDDWTINGEFGFEMTFRVNFEKGCILFKDGKTIDYPQDKAKFEPELSKENGYYLEIKYFINSILNNTPVSVNTPESNKLTIEIAEAEKMSADNRGAITLVK